MCGTQDLAGRATESLAGAFQEENMSLIITRKEGERLLFILPDGSRIVVRTRTVGDRVKLAIDAPECVVVLREELAAHLLDEERSAD